MSLSDSEKRLAILDRLPVLDIDLDDLAGRLRLDLVHQLHRLNDTDDGVRRNLAPFGNIRLLIRSRRAIESTNDR